MKKFLIILGILCSFSSYAQDALIVDCDMSIQYSLNGFILEDGSGYECNNGSTWAFRYNYNPNTKLGNAIVFFIAPNGNITLQRVYQDMVLVMMKDNKGMVKLVLADQYSYYLSALSIDNCTSWVVSLQHKLY